MVTYNADLVTLFGKIAAIMAILYLAFKAYREKKDNYIKLLIFYGITILFFIVSIFEPSIYLIIGYCVVIICFIFILNKKREEK